MENNGATPQKPTREAIKTRLQALPEKPGVYLYKDAVGKILYVGKAKVLRNRVRSYFNNKRLDSKTLQLVSQIHDFDYIVTDTEHEALLLETSLIKKERPKYNIIMKDDKNLPYIKVMTQEKYPRVVKTRQLEDDGNRYFGPFSAGGSASRTLVLIEKLFPLCSRPDPITGTQDRPCLQYYIHRCLGACAGKADPDEYKATARDVILFLEGKHEQLIRSMEWARDEAAEKLEFERAAVLRDQINDLNALLERQKVMLPAPVDMDVVGVAIEGEDACAEVLFIRAGKLIGHDHWMMNNAAGESEAPIQQTFVEQFYANAAQIPKVLLLGTELLDPEPVQEMLVQRLGARVTILVPKRGEKKALIELARNNAREALERERFKWLSDEQKRTGALLELQGALGLPSKPQRIECFDISNVQGASPVASMVVFENGGPARSEYRRFSIKTVQGPNDFEMMREALTRRFKRATDGVAERHDETVNGQGETTVGQRKETVDGWAKLPDLLVVDGGKGQLGVAVEVLAAAGLCDLPVVGLAKQQEEIFRPGYRGSLLLPRNSEALYLMQRIRDEAHRFAVTYHRNVRSKKSVRSPLDSVHGVGPKRKKALIQAFGGVSGIRSATVEELTAVKGIDRATAERIKEAI